MPPVVGAVVYRLRRGGPLSGSARILQSSCRRECQRSCDLEMDWPPREKTAALRQRA